MQTAGLAGHPRVCIGHERRRRFVADEYEVNLPLAYLVQNFDDFAAGQSKHFLDSGAGKLVR